MSHLVRLRGKDTVQTAHCAVTGATFGLRSGQGAKDCTHLPQTHNSTRRVSITDSVTDRLKPDGDTSRARPSSKLVGHELHRFPL